MLTGIDPRMTPELLHCLARMGHGDEIAVVDANYPAARSAAGCVLDTPLPLAGLDAAAAVAMICALMPLDAYFDHAALRMQVDGAPDDLPPVHLDAARALAPHLPGGRPMGSIERQAYYARAERGFAVVTTSETRPFGCFILRKGVVAGP
ncbi:RbsD/FucU family protein [Limimaricola pyoseonensis]|uniref:L-fucose mutarotase n=1 Tax=Limimaricola pyoseonensis TaxID=521013 RepID=A0A1G7FMD0_9RHOB|nr:RbsD/FucU domain-containing protein [Limimaricola pyoseonensis]SDE77052.1 L-fucose mutarotase [Limimaricola pyoseonensis]